MLSSSSTATDDDDDDDDDEEDEEEEEEEEEEEDEGEDVSDSHSKDHTLAQEDAALTFSPYDPFDVVGLFASLSSPSGLVLRSDWVAVASSMDPPSTGADFYDAVAAPGRGPAKGRDLAIAASLFCGGEGEDRARACFAAAQDAGVVVLGKVREVLGRVGVDLGDSEAEVMDQGQFVAWYCREDYGQAPPPHPQAASATLESLREPFVDLEVGDVRLAFEAAAAGGYVPERAFLGAVRNLTAFSGGGAKAQASDGSKIWALMETRPPSKLPIPYVRAVHESIGSPPDLSILDAKLRRMGGVVSLGTAVSAFTVLCGSGTRLSKVGEAFDVITAGTGRATREQAEVYMSDVLRVLECCGEAGGLGPEECAEEAFKSAGVAPGGKITASQFERWLSEGGGPARLDFDGLKSACKGVGVKHLYRAFAEVADPSGLVGRADFQDAFRGLGVEDRWHGEVSRLYDVLWTDPTLSGAQYDVVVSGLSVLFGGSYEDKIREAFDIFDLNGDGYISFEEMCTYMTSIFTVQFEVDPNVRDKLMLGETTPEELGEMTAADVFAEADLNEDGRLR